MKRLTLGLILLLTTVTLFAGEGSSCDMAKHAKGKAVTLTGTLVTTGSGENAKTIFRLSDSDRSYTVCEQTKKAVLDMANDGTATLRVKGHVMKCHEGEELVIESAAKI
ncbi:MAG TPA: hypothetical protein VF824_22500 [Thermoanaerobaculia bacterium]